MRGKNPVELGRGARRGGFGGVLLEILSRGERGCNHREGPGKGRGAQVPQLACPAVQNTGGQATRGTLDNCPSD